MTGRGEKGAFPPKKRLWRALTRGLAFRILAPVLLLTVALGAGISVFVLRGVSGFVETHIRENLGWVARDVYDICDRNLNDLLRSGLSSDPRAERIRRGMTLGSIEDFLRRTGFGGIVYVDGTEEVIMSHALPALPSKIIAATARQNALARFESEGEEYFTYHIRFEPWRWHIVLVKGVGSYSELLNKITFAYAATGAILVLCALFLIFHLNATVRDPIRRMIGPIEKGDPPLYKGIAEFEFLSDRIRHMMETLREKAAAERRFEAQLNQTQRMEAVGRLAGGIAHDINNFLGAITGYAELVKLKRADDVEVARKMTSIMDISSKASALIKQLLAFSRRQPVKPEIVNVNDVIGRIDMMIRRVTGETIRLELAFAEDLWNVRIDPSQAEQILVNMVVNAREAMEDGGTLSIRTENVVLDDGAAAGQQVPMPAGEYVLLTIADTGTGIPEEIRGRIFEPFFTTKEPGRGTGLGLSTVYGVVKQNGGFIFADSAVGRGTTFRIYLPRCAQDPAESPETILGVDVRNTGSEKVLLVEDNADVRETTRALLRALKYEVVTAAGGEEALEIFEEQDQDFDLVITDVIMPGMSGGELAMRIRQKVPGLPILFMSGYTYDVISHHGKIDQGITFLQKPFAAKDLAAKIREALGERAAGKPEAELTR